jgi:hypothetical protein
MRHKKGALTLAAVAILAAALLTLGPGITGHLFATQFKKGVKQADSEHPELGWEVTRYERHWFGAEAETELILNDPQGRPAARFTLEHDIHHGPGPTQASLIRMGVTATDNPDWQRLREAIFDGRQPLTATYWLGPGGGHTLRAQSPDIGQVPMPDGKGRITWQGLQARLGTDRDRETLALRLRLPGLRLDRPDGQLHFEQWHLEAEASRLRPHVWVGDGEATLAGLALDAANPAGPAPIRMDLAEVTLAGELREQDGLLQGQSRLTTGPLQLRNFRLEAIDIRDRITDLSPAFVEETGRALADLDIGPDTPEAAIPGRIGEALDQLPLGELTASGPRYELTRLQATTSAGDIRGQGHIELRPAEDRPVASLARLAGLTRAEASLQAPEGIVAGLARRWARSQVERMADRRDRSLSRQQTELLARRIADQQLGQLREQGLVEQKEGSYRITAAWDGETLSLNDRPILRPLASED